MVTLNRASTSRPRPLSLILLGAVAAFGALYATSITASGWLTGLLFLVAGIVLAALPVRLRGARSRCSRRC